MRAQALAGEFGPVDVEAEVALPNVGDIPAWIGPPVSYGHVRLNGMVVEMRRTQLTDGGFGDAV